MSEAAAERARFLRRLDHEFKNPLMAIRAALANLADTADPSEREQIRHTIDGQTRRLTYLVTNLRKIANIETQPLEMLPVHLDALCQEAISLAGEEPHAAARELRITHERPGLVIHGDHDLLLLALFNLLQNAIKFSHEGDMVTLSTMPDGDMVIVSVADTGPGIAAEDVPHVWEELYRGRHSHNVPGSGIGLALVKSIVERHNGLAAVREGVHPGTVVDVWLPVAHG